jgi:hypothetical protein
MRKIIKIIAASILSFLLLFVLANNFTSYLSRMSGISDNILFLSGIFVSMIVTAVLVYKMSKAW